VKIECFLLSQVTPTHIWIQMVTKNLIFFKINLLKILLYVHGFHEFVDIQIKLIILIIETIEIHVLKWNGNENHFMKRKIIHDDLILSSYIVKIQGI
jgi:hypothetical protein